MISLDTVEVLALDILGMLVIFLFCVARFWALRARRRTPQELISDIFYGIGVLLSIASGSLMCESLAKGIRLDKEHKYTKEMLYFFLMTDRHRLKVNHPFLLVCRSMSLKLWIIENLYHRYHRYNQHVVFEDGISIVVHSALQPGEYQASISSLHRIFRVYWRVHRQPYIIYYMV